MPRFVAKKKTVESKEFATTKNILDLLEVTRRVYLSAIKFSAPIKVKIGDRLFDGATYLKAENIAEKTAIIEDPLNPNETVVKLAADLTIVSNDSTAIFCEFQFIVDTKTRKKENIKEAKVNTDSNNKKIEKWIEKQLNLANTIWAEVTESFESEEFAKLTTHDQLKYFQGRYANFNKQHPLALRYMIEARQYKEAAFRKYISKVSKSQVGSEKIFFERQADYVVYLWKEQTPKYDTKKAKELWEHTYETIHKESNMFKGMQEAANEIASKIDSETMHKYKEQLYQQIEQIRDNGSFQRVQTSKDRRIAEMARRIETGEESSADESPDFSRIIPTPKDKRVAAF